MMRSPSLVACAFLAIGSPALSAQDSAAAVYAQFVAAQKAAKTEARAAAARALLADRSPLFAAGDGLHYKARLQELTGPWREALASYRAHEATAPGTPLANDSLVLAAKLLHARDKDFAGAARLLEKVARDRLSAECQPTYDSLVLWTASDAAHAAMLGKPAPALRPLKVVQGEADLSLAKLRGKVVLLEYWATW